MDIFHHVFNTWKGLSPDIKKRLVVMFTILIVCNMLVWIFGFFLSQSLPILLGLLTIAYGLGLRHAVDADHIAAIDNTTRKLIREGEKPVGVGFFFALGHSTIVIILSLLIAIASSHIKNYFFFLSSVGFIAGSAFSSIFLIVIGVINLLIFIDLLKTVKKKDKTRYDTLISRGPLSKLLKPLFKSIGKSWHMYFIGILFGLGFDTATEVGLLSLSALNSIQNFLIILLLPIAFTTGMILIDTLDGVLMLGAYGWANIKPSRKLYYNLIITLLSVIIAFLIAGIQVITMISSRLAITFTFVDTLGFYIVGGFLLLWIFSFGYNKLRQN